MAGHPWDWIMIKRVMFLSAAVFTMAACSTMADLRHDRPDLELSTHKTPDDYGMCLSTAWGSTSINNLQEGWLPDKKGYNVSLLGGMGADAVMDAEPQPDGSTKVTIWYRSKAFGYGARETARAKACL